MSLRVRPNSFEVTGLVVNQRLLRRLRPADGTIPWSRAEVDWAEHHVTHHGERLEDYRP